MKTTPVPEVRDFSPLMLMITRESRRMSQTALAKASGISQSALSQMESGNITPSEEVAQRLAEQLHYPRSLLGVKLRFQQLPVTFFRKKSRVAVRDVNAIRASVNLYRLRLEILLRAVEGGDAKLALADLVREGLSPERAAERLRAYWNVPPGPVGNLTGLIEQAGILVVPVDFGTAQVDGLSLYEPNDQLPPIIFVNTYLPSDRWRLTLAHELGHIVLHHHLSIPPDDKDMEAEAFAFAAEFLAPLREIGGYLQGVTMQRLADLKRHWGMSMASMLKRAQSLRRVSDRQARRLWIQLRQYGINEPVTIPGEQPSVIQGIVARHLDELGYSVSDLSRALHQQVDEFRSTFGVGATHLRLA